MNLLYANDRPGHHAPSWYAATAHPHPTDPALEGDIRTDVAVVGGGYTGLSAALHLAQAGRQVVLVDAHRAGWGASGRNGGQVGSGQRVDQPELEATFGPDRARALWQIGQDAKALVRDLIARHDIACDLRPGILYADHRQRHAADTREYVDHMNRVYDYPVEYLTAAQVREHLGTEAYHSGLLDPDGAHLHPLNYALGLAAAARAAGASLYGNTRVTARQGRVLHTARGRIEADHVILACNGYLGDLDGVVARHVMPINNFIVATEPLGDRAQELMPKDVAVADSKFVVNYFRLSDDGRMLFGGGESYGYKFPSDIRAVVSKPMLEVFPQLKDVKLDYAWGGTLAITRKRMPYLTRPAPNMLSASGYSGHGVGTAVHAGQLMAHAIQGQAAGFDALALVPLPAFPGGGAFRSPLLALAMTWFALRDRIGL